MYKMTYSKDSLEKRKNRIFKIIEEKGLCSVMNTTKWREVKKVVEDISFQPPFIIKKLDEEETEYHFLDKDSYHENDWGLYLNNYLGGDIYAVPYFAVKWIKVKPRILQEQGKLLPPKVIDKTEEFVAGLKKHNIPYEEMNGSFVIYGYK